MERALAWIDCYKALDAEMKRALPLYRRGMCSIPYWQSLKKTENQLEDEYNSIRKEANWVFTIVIDSRFASI